MAEKDQKPTAKRLRDAREKGDVPKSAETVSSAFFVGVCVALAVGIGSLFARLQALFRLVFDAVGAADPSARLAVLIDGAARDWATLSAQIVAAGLLAGLLAGFVQVGGVMAWSRLVPQLSRLNPAEGMKNLWSLRNLVNLAKMLLKTALLVATLGWLIVESLDPSVQSGFTRPVSILALIVKLLMLLFGWAALIYIVMALIDIVHQRHEFNQKMKMSVDEVRREHKEDEGDPHIEAKRRQLAREAQFASLPDRIGYASVSSIRRASRSRSITAAWARCRGYSRAARAMRPSGSCGWPATRCARRLRTSGSRRRCTSRRPRTARSSRSISARSRSC